jgi:hypothetical protein
VLWLIALPPALLLGAHLFGLVGVAAAQVVVSVVVVIPAYGVLLRRAGVRLGGLVRELIPSLVAGVGIFGATYAIAQLVPSALLVCITAGLTAMSASVLLLYLKRDELAVVRDSRSRRTPS